MQVNPGRPEIGPDTVLFGIGNCGRADDGLGWAFLDAVQKIPGFCGRAEYRYQLQVEDALLASTAKNVVFIDSSRSPLPTGFEIRTCRPAKDFEFTTHVLRQRRLSEYRAIAGNCRPACRIRPQSTWPGRWPFSRARKPEAQSESGLGDSGSPAVPWTGACSLGGSLKCRSRWGKGISIASSRKRLMIR